MLYILRSMRTILIFLFFLTGAADASTLRPGSWRGVLQLNDSTELPFIFEVYDTAGTTTMMLFNAEEQIRVTEISFTGDSVIIRLPVYDSEFRCRNYSDSLKGRWINHSRKD